MLKVRHVLPALAAAGFLWASGVPAPGAAYAADDCPRGFLDKRYCDRDGDLVADLPADPKQWVNPSTIIFSYTPVEDPAVYKKVWDGFIQHMAKTTGKKVVFFPVQSYAAQYEAMRSGRLHVAGVNTGGNPVAVACAGFVPFAMMASKDGSYGYEMEIIAPADSALKGPADLKGKALAFTSPTSNSGFKAPSAILKSEFGLVAKKDFKTAFSGKHDNSILGVANKDYEAAAVANSVLKRMIDRKVDRRQEDQDHLQVADLPDDGLRPRPQFAPRSHGSDQAGVLHLQLGGLRPSEGVQEGRPLRRHQPQARLGHHSQDRCRQRRQVHLQVMARV